MSLALTTDSTSTTLVPLADIRELLGFDATWKTNTLTDILNGARSWAEKFTDRSFIQSTWTMKLDKFPSLNSDQAIHLPKGKFVSLTSLKYVATSGTLTTLTENTDFTVHSAGDIARLTPTDSSGFTTSWPNIGNKKEAVQVVWIAGYGTAATDVPGPLITGVKLAIQDMYCNEKPGAAAEAMLKPYQIIFEWQSFNR